MLPIHILDFYGTGYDSKLLRQKNLFILLMLFKILHVIC